MTDAIIPGFHPDPSICRVGEQYYLANSSFEYFPGVPVFTSRDLLTWEQIGNVLDRPTQLNVRPGIEGASGGIYAPTLRHHDDRFWLATTNIHDVGRGHLIVNSVDPAGPWSDPVYTSGLIGIDPDLSWDHDGTCLLTWSDVVRGGISQAKIDPLTGDVLSDAVSIWQGTGGAHAEGPHVIRRGRWWYLLVAEGGTGAGHMVTVARSSHPSGPFEAHPANPILTHRSTSDPVQSTGHADLVERPDGSWALVFLGTRPRGSFPRWHTNGRETFVADVEWVDEWPVVIDSPSGRAPIDHPFSDAFRAERLHPRWISPGVDPAVFATPGPDGARLAAPDGARESRLLAIRADADAWSARIEASGDVSLELRMDDRHRAAVERRGDQVAVRIIIGPLEQVVTARTFTAESVLEIRSVHPDVPRGAPRGPDVVVLGVIDAEEFIELARMDGRYLSTEVAGGFTGRVIGVSALDGPAIVRRFDYSPTA